MSLFNSKTAKFFVGFVALAMVVTFVAAPSDAKAQTTSAELQAQINTLLAQIAALQGGATVTESMSPFTRDLTVGSTGADVMQLQKWMNGNGYTVSITGAGSPGMETSTFGPATRAAVAKFQAAMGISPAVGYFGPATRASLNAKLGTVVVTPGTFPAGCTSASGFSSTTGMPCTTSTLPAGCTSTAGFSPTTGMSCSGGSTPSTGGTLQGGAGSIETYTAVSGLNNEEVGEGQDDVEVAGLEIEAGEESDIEISAVKLVFNEGTAASDFDKYASEVSIWLDGEEFARIDADEFKDVSGTANDWTKTVSLDSGAIVLAGETEDLVVRVSGVSNLDTADASDTWTIDMTSVRFKDATGVTISEDPGMTAITFSFDTFAAANDVEMKTNLATDNPDEGVVAVDSENQDIVLMKFKIKAEGSDLTVKEIPVALTTGASLGNIDQLVDELGLDWGDADASESVPASSGTTETVTFDALDIVIEDGETFTFTLTGKTATSSVTDADAITIQATITPDDIIAEDNTGEDITNADSTGSATGETQHVFSIVPEIEVTDVSITANDNGTAASESAAAVIELSITARGGTLYINGDNSTTENLRFFVGQTYGSVSSWDNDLVINAAGVTASTTASTTVYTPGGQYTVSGSGTTAEYFTIAEDETMTITIDSTVAQAISGTNGPAISAGLKALLFQYGTAATTEATRSAIDLNWTDLTDQTQTGVVSLVNPS